MTAENIDDKLYLFTAKTILNSSGFVFNPSVLNAIDINDIVRIVYIDESYNSYNWSHDSPFVKIVDINNDDVLGQIQNINRIPNTNEYLLNIGEKIWFKKNNIIEIYTEGNYNKNVNRFLTREKVLCTGPLYTVNNESDSESGSSESSSSDYISDSD